ncbi:MAG: PorV/PorQ family protein [Flavobacteriales bacterium]
MSNILKLTTLAVLTVLLTSPLDMLAGNKDRAGSAGAPQLLINPWARSGGLANSNMASIRGVESVFLNVAGLAFTDRTELVFTNSNYLVGSDISINSFALGQRVSETSVLSLSVMSMSFGDIPITTTDIPDGGIGNFSPTFSNLALSYAKEFSNSIYGGITMRVVSESISNVNASGISFDAGIQYITGERDQVKFGISLKNVGPTMRYEGDGLSTAVSVLENGAQLNLNQKSANLELPSLVHIGFGYDFLFNENMSLMTSAQFTSNSFSRDQIGLGADLNFKDRFNLRAGYLWEDQITDDIERTTALTGLTAGLSVNVPLGKNESSIGFDYNYRTTVNFDGVHSIGAHINL